MKHVIVRGRPVRVVKTGDRFRPAPVEVPCGSLVVSPETTQTGSLFFARIIGESWQGYGDDPIAALVALVEDIFTDGHADYDADLPSLLRFIHEEI